MSLDIPRQLPPTSTTEQPLPRQPNIPEPPYLVSRNSTLNEHENNMGERIAAPQRLSTRAIYTSIWLFPTMVHRRIGELQESLYR